MRSAQFARLIVLVSVAVSACTVKDTDIPSLTGPSEYALSIEVTATPDHIRQDGESQSAVVVRARDANGQPVRALAIRLDMAVGPTIQDFGTLSERNVVTGNDGLAKAVYTAPPTPQGFNGSGTTMSIRATPYGTNSLTSVSHSVSIELVPPGVILPPGGAPTASFVVSPTPLSAGVAARFDASASLPGTDSSQLTYSWSFGDGSGASGVAVNHTFATVGTFSVTLTVTNDRGLTAQTMQPVSVGATALPVAVFVFSPAAPVPGKEIQFNGQGSTAPSGRRITQYLWNWGDGETGTGALQQHDYLEEGVYSVVLTVVDDIGQRGSATQPVTVKFPDAPTPTPPTAAFVFSPAEPEPDEPVLFNAGVSSPGPATRQYRWNWGDGTTTDTLEELQSHTYEEEGTYTVVLTVIDGTDPAQRDTDSKPVPVGIVTPPTP
ncbi:MAG: PKD domain-containing protein [Luteitalea sp.]|nr:PKD domain-containing protein [Luteitalea sp.]